MFYTTTSIIKVSSHELNNRNVNLRVIACKLFVMHFITFTGTMLKGREEFEAAHDPMCPIFLVTFMTSFLMLQTLVAC